MVRYPTPYLEGEGVITEVLGRRGQPGVDTLTVIRAFNIPDTFDDDVLDEAREQARHFDEDEIGGRLDLRDVLTVTIDPATARDFDDAISLSRDDQGYWSLGVHIADVSHFVRPARRSTDRPGIGARASTSPTASSRCCRRSSPTAWPASRPGTTRYTVSALLEFNAEGILTVEAVRPLGDPGRPSFHLRGGDGR